MIKRFGHILVLSSICIISFSLSARDKIKLAVLDFEAKNISASSAEAVTDLLRTELFNTGHFKVLERQKIRKIIEEQKFQMAGFTDADQAVEIGRMLNVQKIMIGTVTMLGNTHIVNTRIVDVRSGLVVLAESINSKGGEEMLPGAIAELAVSISYKVGLEGKVIRIDDDEVFIDLGSVDGVKLGQRFEVIRQGEVITDLEGRIIGTSSETVGIIGIIKVQDRFSIAMIEDNDEDLIKGDEVKPILEEESTPEWSEPIKPRKKKEKSSEEEDENQPEIPAIF